jgi:hypothetical protein
VAWTLELRPLLNFVPAWERFMLLRLAEIFDQPSIADCLREEAVVVWDRTSQVP